MKLKRIIAIVLCFAMVLSTMSFSVFAEDTTATETSNEKIVAAVGETEYTSLGDAVANADGKTVTLLEDVTLTEKIFLENGMNVTIEGGGKTITFENSKYGFAVKESTLTLGVGLNIVAEGQTCPLYVQDGIAITSANIKTVDGNGYSPIMINGGYRADVTINGGDIVAGDASVPAIYWPGEGTLTVKGGKITGATAIYLKSGNLTITDGELVGNGDKKDYEYVVSGSTPTGDALVIENVGVDDYEAVGTVSITGGKFTSLNAYSVASHTAGNEGVEAVTGFISGGNFSSDVSAFVADGFEYDAETGEIVEETLPVNYVAQVGDEYYTSIDDAIEAAKVTEEKVVTALETIILDEDCTLDLMGVRVNAASSIKNAPIFRILADVTVTNGIVDGKGGINCYAFIVGKGETAGTLTIKDGTYRGVTTAVQISNGTVNISGGTFQTGHDDEGTDYGTQYLLNCMDAAYKNGTAKFNITGGKFVGFNPENNAAEGEGTNFLSGDYKAFENDGRWYVTIPNIEMDGIHYATIKDALWTLKSADTTVHKIKVLKDLEIDVNYSTYNYPILVNGFAIKLDLNGKTLTADWSKYTGSRKDNAIIGVANGGKIDIIDSVGGGKIVNNDNREDVENRIFWIMTSTETKSIVVNIKGGTFVQNDVNTALLYVQGNKPSDNLAPIYINITGGHFETVNDDFFNAYDGYQHESYISGGTFNKNPSDWEIKIHPSFVLVENEDGTWGVVEGDFVAKVGDKSYMDFSEALAAANSVEESATIELLKDVTLGEKLEITGNVTISGEHTITRADDYTGTLFVVNADATLTLDGGLVIDGANVWTLNTELYNKALNREVEGTVWADLITSEENAPNATAAMFVVNGAVVAKDVTIQNNYSTKDSNGGDGGIFKVGANASLTMTGANVKHIVTGGANSVAYVASGATWTINEGTLITDTFAARNGGVCRTDGGYIVMNGGIIEKNNSLNTNGTVFMMYNGAFTMNGGKICSNTGISGTNNGRCAAIYLHSNGAFTMNGGEICHNTGISYGGVDTNKTNSMLTVTGGYIGENISVVDNANADVNFYNPDNASITGGKFTQDVSAWLAPDSGLVYDEATGTYGLTQDLYEYNGVAYKSLADVIAAIASTPAMLADEDATPVVKVLASHRPSATIAIDTNIILDLNGKNLYGVTGVNPIIRVLADVTITGNGMIDSANQGDGYCFIVGSSDGPVAGNLTIENGTFKGTTTAVSVTKGTATILDGDFRVKPYQVDGQDDNYNFLLNCIDANYKDGSAKIIVKGGKFTKFNPADNAAEGANTSFVASGHMAVDNDDETWNVIGMVAMIGETKFATLTEAIKTAQANDTITLLADVTEDVTINKSITLDGGNFKYTGNISVSGSTSEVTVKNVNFVNGTGYAVTTNRIKSITVEDCTVSNYAWGFLYANKSTPTVVVKNVTVDGGNYGFHWVYGTSATLENVTMTNVTNGLLIQNYAGKTVTLKNCNLTNINIWERDGSSGVQTFKFEGTNTVATLSASQYAKYVLGENATLKAPEGYTVTASNDAYFVKYVDGIYKSVKAVAQVGEVKYESLAEAIAVGGDVILLADVENAGKIVVNKDVSLDLNGKTISGVCDEGQKYVFMVNNGVAMNIKDSSAEKTGKITYAGNNSTGWIIDVEGNLVLESGTLELTGTWNIGYAVDVRPNAWGTAYTEETSFVMDGGKITSSDGAVRVASSSADTYKDVSASFTMNGGEIEAAWDGIFVQQSDAAWDVLSFTINDGTIKSGLNPVRLYGPAATSYVNGENCIDIALNGGELEYTGTEAREWLVDGIIRIGGGAAADEFVKNSTVTASADYAQSNVADGYSWVSIGNKYQLQILGGYVFVVDPAETELVQGTNEAFTVDVKVASEKVDTFYTAEYIVKYDTALLTCAEDNAANDYDKTVGVLRLQALGTNTNVGESIGTLTFTAKEFDLTKETKIEVAGSVLATQFDSITGNSVEAAPGEGIVVMKETLEVTVGEGLEGDNVAYNGTDYVISVAEKNQGKQNTVNYTINGDEYSVVLPAGTNEFTIEGDKITGNMTFEIADSFTVTVIAPYVTGYALVLVEGSADGYTYDGHQMFKIDRATEGATLNYNGRYGWLVDGSAEGTTIESVTEAAYKTITAGGVSASVETTCNVNSCFVKDGKINFQDVSAAYACQRIDFALTEADMYYFMELYLASDVNCDGIVNVLDTAMISNSYN